MQVQFTYRGIPASGRVIEAHHTLGGRGVRALVEVSLGGSGPYLLEVYDRFDSGHLVEPANFLSAVKLVCVEDGLRYSCGLIDAQTYDWVYSMWLFGLGVALAFLIRRMRSTPRSA